MSTVITWPDIALRLALAIAAGGMIGLNRGEHGLPAGLRTTLLVCEQALRLGLPRRRRLGGTGLKRNRKSRLSSRS